MRHSPSLDDRASTQVLEAVVIVSVMVSAIAFVVTFEQPASTTDNARDGLSQVADDVLKILYDTPIDSRFGDDELSAYIASCLNDICDPLVENVSRLLPPGAAFAIYVSNGYDTYPVWVEAEPIGEAVSATQTFEPRWSNSFISTATDMVGADEALLTYSLPIMSSNVVSPGGSHLLVRITAERGDTSDYVLTSSYSTVAQSSSTTEPLAASLRFIDGAGASLPVLPLPGGPGTTHTLVLRLEEHQGGLIPAGAEVAVEMPRGWTAVANAPDNPGWAIVANATDKSGSSVGSTVRALLNNSLRTSSRDLRLTVTYHGDLLDYYPITAHLARGALATAQILVRGEEHDAVPALATPLVAMSVPAPMGKGASTPWTLSVYVPAPEEANPPAQDDRITLKKVEIVEQDGYGIFGGFRDIHADGGTWTSTSKTLTWTGDRKLSYTELLNVTFEVAASGTAGPLDGRAAFYPNVTFDDHATRLISRAGWGFHREAILPEDGQFGGFEAEAGDFATQHDIVSDAIYRSTPLPGSATYNTSVVPSVEEALYGSYVESLQHRVPVGGKVVISANVQSLLFKLAEAGQRAGVTLRFYPPWSADERKPIFEVENLDEGLLSGEVTKLVMIDINDDGYPDPVVGTNNGRVMGYHALTGQRLQGGGFTAPFVGTANVDARPQITALDTISLRGKDYIVVGTDEHSGGVYVLAKNFTAMWETQDVPGGVMALDTRTDFDGDREPDIVVTSGRTDQGQDATLTYILVAPPTFGPLATYRGLSPPSSDPAAFALTVGHAETILTSPRGGPFGEFARVAVPIQSLYDPGVHFDPNGPPGDVQTGDPSLPRAGVQAFNELGEETSTLFGAPASVLRTYNYGGDAVDDMVMGGTSGYVVMANGTALTQPLFSLVAAGFPSIIAADTRTSMESYVLMENGMMLMTDDGWVSNWGPDNVAAGGLAIAANAPNDVWVVGRLGAVYRNTVDPGAPMAWRAQMPTYKEFEQVTLETVQHDQPHDVDAALRDLTSIWMREGHGIIVTTPCWVALSTECKYPAILETFEGEKWEVLDLDSEVDAPGMSLKGLALTKVKFTHGVGWILGEGGLILRQLPDDPVWRRVPTASEATLRDIDCEPQMTLCYAVGDDATLLIIPNPEGTLTAGSKAPDGVGLPLGSGKKFFSVGFADSDRVFIGSENLVLMKLRTANWTAMPMNYLQNDARVVNALGQGDGYIYGGEPSNARIWSIHDYATQTSALTKDLAAKLTPGKTVKSVALSSSNVTLGLQQVVLNVSTNGEDWTTLGPILTKGIPPNDPRLGTTPAATIPAAQSGNELYLRIVMNTSGDMTIVTPSVRSLTFAVGYTDGTSSELRLAFDSDEWLDPVHTTADWNTTAGALRQGFVREYWTRNVSGEVHDIQSGFDLDGDGRSELWVGTGDVLAENSPDHAIYAEDETDAVIEADDRVYLLSGADGHPRAISPHLNGEVRALNVSDPEGDRVPNAVYAIAWDADATSGELYALDPTKLEVLWHVPLADEAPRALGVGKLANGHASVFVGSERALPDDEEQQGHLWAWDGLDSSELFRIIPDDLGKYNIETYVEPGWLFGPYVVEVSVEWEEKMTGEGLPEEVVRSARFYDHFMVTPPGALSPPTPVYTARMLVWMKDWG